MGDNFNDVIVFRTLYHRFYICQYIFGALIDNAYSLSYTIAIPRDWFTPLCHE